MDALTLQQEAPPGVEQVFSAIGELLPVIRARRAEIESGRRLPPDLVDRLRATGIFRLGVPRVLGGEEVEPTTLLAAIETVSTADASTGWCTMIGVSNGVSAGYLPDRGAREMFADPSAPTAGIAAPEGAAVREAGGVRVSGRWGFASGITHSGWLWAGCLVMENGQPRMTANGPEIVHVAMPVREVEVEDTWHVSGLSGSGSNHVRCSDVFVPEHRIFLLLDPTNHRPEPLYRMPPLGIFVYQLVAVALGVARAAIDELVELAQTKVPSLNRVVLAEKPVAQVEVARAEAALGGARSYVYGTVREIWETVRGGGEPTLRQLANGRIAAMQAVETAANVTREMNVLAGGGAIYAGASLQRHARDAEAILHHFTVAPHIWEEAGRVMMGRAPTVPVF